MDLPAPARRAAPSRPTRFVRSHTRAAWTPATDASESRRQSHRVRRPCPPRLRDRHRQPRRQAASRCADSISGTWTGPRRLRNGLARRPEPLHEDLRRSALVWRRIELQQPRTTERLRRFLTSGGRVSESPVPRPSEARAFIFSLAPGHVSRRRGEVLRRPRRRDRV